MLCYVQYVKCCPMIMTLYLRVHTVNFFSKQIENSHVRDDGCESDYTRGVYKGNTLFKYNHK